MPHMRMTPAPARYFQCRGGLRLPGHFICSRQSASSSELALVTKQHIVVGPSGMVVMLIIRMRKPKAFPARYKPRRHTSDHVTQARRSRNKPSPIRCLAPSRFLRKTVYLSRSIISSPHYAFIIFWPSRRFGTIGNYCCRSAE